MHRRYAVFYLPIEGSPLADFGASWLGYDIAKGQAVTQIEPNEFDLAALTQKARNYGFHATLKAPFQLRKKFSLEDLERRIEKQAQKSNAFQLAPLKLSALGYFTTLVPKHNKAKLNRLEENLVIKLNKFQKKLTAIEYKARTQVTLNALETEYLKEYKYPYVLDHFRFHFTLCDRADKETRAKIVKFVETRYSEIYSEPIELSQIALVGEREDGFFEVINHFKLGENN